MTAPKTDVIAVLRRHAVAERERLGTTDNDAQAALSLVTELFACLSDIADECMGVLATTVYLNRDDDVGDRVCCDVASYQPHAESCPAVRLRSILSRCTEN